MYCDAVGPSIKGLPNEKSVTTFNLTLHAPRLGLYDLTVGTKFITSASVSYHFGGSIGL